MKRGAIFFCGWVLWHQAVLGGELNWDPVAGFETLAACQKTAITYGGVGGKEDRETKEKMEKLWAELAEKKGLLPPWVKCLPAPADPRPRTQSLK